MKRAVAASLVALLAYCGVLALILQRNGGDISLLVVAGGGGVHPSNVPPGLTVDPKSGGYDGMMFYRLALDPFTDQQTANGITLDEPSYRQQRILYPLIVWLLSFGRAEAVPLLLVLVNLAAIATLGFAGAMIARRYDFNELWGVVFALYPGFLLSFSRDTCEIVACAFGACAIWMYGASRWKTCTLLLCCAMLTRETLLMLAIGIGFVWLFRRAVPLYTFLTPGALYVIWQLVLGSRWDQTPLAAGTPDRTAPFAGYLNVFADSMARRTVLDRTHFAECIYWALLVALVLIIWRTAKVRTEWRFAWIGYVALAGMLGRDIWTEHFAFMRVLGDLYLATIVFAMSGPRTARWLASILTAVLWWHVATHL